MLRRSSKALGCLVIGRKEFFKIVETLHLNITVLDAVIFLCLMYINIPIQLRCEPLLTYLLIVHLRCCFYSAITTAAVVAASRSVLDFLSRNKCMSLDALHCKLVLYCGL